MAGFHPVSWLRSHERAADAILAVLITVVFTAIHYVDPETVVEMNNRDPTWWTGIFVVASLLPVALRRVQPIASGVFIVGAQVVTELLDIFGTGYIGVVIALYSIGAHTSGPRRTAALYASAVAIGVLFVTGLFVNELDLGSFISSVVILVTAFVLGDNLRRRREKADSLIERAERAEREQQLIAEQQVNAERTRIARELHDVVAHSVSVMVIQAAAARRTMEQSPDSANAALVSLEDTGRQTMNELRGILGVLRHENGRGNDPNRAPQPQLSEAAALVASATDLPITFTMACPVDDITQSVTLTGYRILQEALTNVRRHAGLVTDVVVTIERTGDELTLSVIDNGRGAAADDVGEGYGIVGMHERVAAVGGTLSAGPNPGGGWRIVAVLPAPEPTVVASQMPHAEATQ